METQPQLLLLQKTMVVIEGVGRRLDPEINIWTLARPLIEEWMRDNRGPEARVRLGLETIADLVERVPRLVRSLDDTDCRLVAPRDRAARRNFGEFRPPIVPGIWQS